MSAASVATYIWGQCTAFVASTLSWVQGGWGNANQWPTNAARQGYPVGHIPHVNDVAAWPSGFAGAGSVGHVARVSNVSTGGITVAEENWSGGPGVTDTRFIPANIVGGLTFISPKGTTQGGGGPSGGGDWPFNQSWWPSFVGDPASSSSGDLLGLGTVAQAINNIPKAGANFGIYAGFFMLALVLIFAGLLFMVFSSNAGRTAAKEGAVIATV